MRPETPRSRAHGSSRALLLLALGLLLPGAAAASNLWTESSLTPSADLAPQPSYPYPAAGVPVLNSNSVDPGDALGQGQGVLTNDSDTNSYQFQINANDVSGNNNMLQVTLASPAGEDYNLNFMAANPGCSCWNGAGGGVNGNNNGVVTYYYSLAGASFPQSFYIEVSSENGVDSSPYTVTVAVVPSATITGAVGAVGVGASGLSGFNVFAVDGSNGQYSSSFGTDSGGNYSVSVPLGVTITSVVATRYWYSSSAPDWPYGPTIHMLASPVAFSSGGATLGGVNFSAYPEAVLKGTYSGTSRAPQSWSVNLEDEYNRNNGGNYVNGNNGLPAGSFEFHNLMPGTWHLEVAPNDGNAPIVSDNVVLTDGLANTGLALAFNTGASLTVNLPWAVSGQQVDVNVHGTGENITTLYNVSGTSVVIPALPVNQSYDISVGGNGGPGVFFPDSGVAVGAAGSYFTSVQGLSLTSSISGGINDLQGYGAANLGVYAFPHGGNPADGGSPASFSAVTQVGSVLSYSVPVDPSYQWDLVLINPSSAQNGIPPVYAWLAGLAPGSSGNDMTSQASFTVGGTLQVQGTPATAAQLNDLFSGNGASVSAFGPTGNWAGGWSENGGPLGAGFVIPGLVDASYNIQFAPHYMVAANQAVAVNGLSQVGADLSVSVDPAQDVYLPYASGLIPANSQTVGTLPAFSLTLSDGILGTGVAAVTAANVRFDGGAFGANVSGFSFNSGTGAVSFSPGAPLAQGLTHTVTVKFSDQASTPNVNTVTWSIYIPPAGTPTISPTYSVSPTQSPTATVSPPETVTPSSTVSPPFTATASATASPTATATPSASESPSATPTPTASQSFTQTPHETATPSPSASPTATPDYLWTEAALAVGPECPTCSGQNDSTPSGGFGASGSAILNPGGAGTALGLGAGYLGSASDKDVYQFRIRSGDYNVASHLDMLEVTLTSPSNYDYSLNLSAWNNGCSCWNGGGGGGGNNGVEVQYFDLSQAGGNQDFYAQVSNYGGSVSSSAYTLRIQVVPSGTITGSVLAQGALTSGNGNFNVSASAWGSGTNLNSTQTDGSGSFSLRVPANVQVGALTATRSWQNGQAADWSYGPSDLSYASPQTLAQGGVLGGQVVKAWPDAVLSGTYTGTSNGPQNWNFSLEDEYTRNNNGTLYNGVTWTAGTYALHNQRPGTYHLRIDPQDGVNAPAVFDDVVLTDGLATTRNLSFATGGSISGTISPAGSGLNVNVYESGFSGNSVTSTGNVGGAFSFSRLAPGLYDVQVGSNGPGVYFTAFGVSVAQGSSTPVNISALAQSATISGSVDDALGLGYGTYAAIALIHGSNPSNGNVPVAFAAVGGTGAFSIPVDPAYASWDIAIINAAQSNGQGFPTVYAGIPSVAPNSSGWVLTATAGAAISGSVLFNNGPLPTDLQSGNGGGLTVAILAAGGLRDGASVVNGAYSSHPLPNGGYTVQLAQKFLTTATLPVTLAGSGLSGENLNLVPAPSQDSFAPYAWQLNPVQGTTVTAAVPAISCLLSDSSLGTGVGSGTIAATVDSVPAASVAYTGATGLLTFQPASALAPGVHTVHVAFSDQASPPNSGSVSWSFTVTANTPTITWTFTTSPTATPTLTITPSATPTVTLTPTPSATPSASPTVTLSFTFSATPTATRSVTLSPTPTVTASFTASPNASPTPSSTQSPSFTASPSFTVSPTLSQSATGTLSATVTPSFTPSPTASPSATPSATASPTPTATPSPSPSASATASPSVTATGTRTPSPSVTCSFTASPSATPSPTVTTSFTQSPTFTVSPTASPTPAFAVSAAGKAQWGPVPAKAGEDITLFFDKAPASAACDVYNVKGQRVADASFGGQGAALHTGGLAPGVYLVRTVVQYQDGSSGTVFQKIVVVR